MTKNEAQATLDFLNQRWLGYENGKHKFYLLADDLKELREKACHESKNGKNQHIECKNLPLCEHYMPYPYETNAKGQIIESGAHNSLYELNGYYTKLCNMQEH